VERNVKFPSSPTEADRYTAENAIQNEDPQEDIKLITYIFASFQNILSASLTIISRVYNIN